MSSKQFSLFPIIGVLGYFSLLDARTYCIILYINVGMVTRNICTIFIILIMCALPG